MTRILLVPVLFCCASYGLFLLASSLPELAPPITPTAYDPNADIIISEVDADDLVDVELKSHLRFPSNLEQLRHLANVLKQYKDDHFAHVFILFSAAYLYKQAFSIPGSVFLNLLAGAVFGISYGFPLVCLLTGQ
jgi:hypothetical protein